MTRIGHRIIGATRNWRGGRVFQCPPKVGKRIHHDIFGAGTVVTYTPPSAPHKRMSFETVGIEFDVHGLKELHWSFCQGKVRSLIARKVTP